MKRKKAQVAEAEDSVTRSAAILATALKDGMGMLFRALLHLEKLWSMRKLLGVLILSKRR